MLWQDSDGSDLVFEHSFPKSKKEQHEKCTPSKSRTHPNIGLENKQEVKTVQDTSKPTPTNANAQETAISYLIRIKRTLELQEQKLSEIDRKVDELSTIIRGQQKSTDIPDDEVHKKLPLSTLEELGDVEKLLENATNLDNFVIYMRQVGGFDYKESVKRCLKKTFNDQLAVIYSFQGHKGKNPFNKTLICTAVIKSILKLHIDCTSKEVEVAISKWLTKAKERMKKNEEHTINFNLEIKS
ncbi:uncharacterized protein LOC126886265 [Diabrotica virgifera virgifera]|uniref:DUF4806 domain-containing protein n=1 Tax=Diabrotica virgifera virgifera TaxID=50390 RepID=A0ABM5KFW9_DIAVI|nr:uncharacterized protein LOC126886265 [Diabrotica virgifera virgifera]